MVATIAVTAAPAYDSRTMIFNKITALNFSYHEQARTGQSLMRVTSDVEVIRVTQPVA